MDIQGLVQASVRNSVNEGLKKEISKVVSKWVRKNRAETLKSLTQMMDAEYDKAAQKHTNRVVSLLVEGDD